MKTTGWVIVATVILISGAVAVTARLERGPAPLDAFAQCLGEKGATFYGAFWCPHCQSQKKLFGRSARLLPYVECSTPDGRGQLPICTEKKIEGYPTWEFADGTRQSGEVPIATLAEKTGCPLPNNQK